MAKKHTHKKKKQV